MKVKRLKIQSFRGIDKLTLDFDPKVTVLIGVNGVGKSSIIICLTILLNVLVKGIVDLLNSSGELPFESLRNPLVELGEIFSKDDISSKSDGTCNEITVASSLQEVSWYAWAGRVGTDDEFFITGENFLRVTQELSSFIVNHLSSRSPKAHVLSSFPVIINYPVNRAVANISLDPFEDSFFGRDTVYFSNLEGKTNFSSFFRWFRTLEDLENEERRDNPEYRDLQLEAVRRVVSTFIPEFSNLRVRRSPLRMTVDKQGQEVVVNQLSDGEKCLLVMVGDIARRLAIANPGLNDPLQGEGVILVDEVELHLHPQWQRRVMLSLTQTFPNCQFIVTSHSPLILGEVQGSVYRLRSTPDGIEADSLQTYGRDSSRILEDEMEADARSVSVKEDLQKLFQFIDDGNLEAARQLQQSLEHLIGEDEPEFAKADVLIRRKEILGR